MCEYMALCTNDATLALPHPILGSVPICRRCLDKYNRLSTSTRVVEAAALVLGDENPKFGKVLSTKTRTDSHQVLIEWDHGPVAYDYQALVVVYIPA